MQVDDEGRRAADDDDERQQPHVERNLAVVADPLCRLRQDEAQKLRRGEGHDEQRGDAGQNLREAARSRSGEGEDDGRHEGHDHIAEQAVGGHRRDVGPEHAGNDDGRHRHGGQDADHRPLCHDLVERTQHEVDADAGRDLDYQQPQVHHRGPHLVRLHAAEGDEEHQENERRGNHLSRPALQCRDGAAQQGADDHGRRHGDGLDVAVQVFEYVHGFRFLFNDSQAPLRAQLCRGLGAAPDRARRSMELPAGILPDIPAGLLAVGIGLLSGSLPGFTSRRTGGHDSNSLTLAEISLPSARPASRFDATPITLPISFIDVAPTSAMMAFTSAVSSSAVSCLGRNSS